MIKKTLLLLVFIGGAFFISLAIFSPSSSSLSEKALDHFLEGNCSKAETILSGLQKKTLSPFPILYQGYLAQHLGQYDKSNHLLHSAFLKTNNKEMLFEIFLAQATNAYLQKHDQKIFPLLESAKKTTFSDNHLPLFEGLANYLQNVYGTALCNWNAFVSSEPYNENSWMGAMIKRNFSSTWLHIHLAHCLIEEGNYLSARETLEKEMHFLSSQEHDLNNLASLFLGLTYLKEANQIPLAQKDSYYKLARFYFDRGQVSDRFFRERNRLIVHAYKEAVTLLKTKEMTQWGLAFIHVLHQWKATPALEMLADHVVKMLSIEPDLKLCYAIHEEFQGNVFLSFMNKKFVPTISHRLKQGSCDNLFAVWECAAALSPSPADLAKQIASLTTDEIFKTIRKDKESLPKTRAYLKFWKHLEKNKEQRNQFAKGLISHGQFLWRQEGEEKKGAHLIEIALNFTDGQEKATLLKEVETFLSDLYYEAESSNMVRRLSLIYDALAHFNFGSKDLTSPEKLANHLADTKYLFSAHNFSCAQTHAQWVLKLDPNNEEGLRLFGLSSYHLGEYRKALATLKKLSNPDQNARKALMLSKVFSSRQQEKHLAQIDTVDDFDENE